MSNQMWDLMADWKAYIESGQIPETLRGIVKESWVRSKEYGVDPLDLTPQIQNTEHLATARARSAGLIEAAEPLLRTLHESLANTPHLVALADRESFILRLLADPTTQAAGRSSNLFEGASWHERALGCNGVGTALAIGQPVVLVGPEHFVVQFTAWTCVGIPLRGPSGQIVGALDLSVPNEHVTVQTWGWALSIAQGIEAALRAAVPPQPTELSALASSFSDGLLAVRGALMLLGSQADLRPSHIRLISEALAALGVVEELFVTRSDTDQILQSDLNDAVAETGRLLHVLDLVSEGVLVVDRELRVSLRNSAYNRILEAPLIKGAALSDFALPGSLVKALSEAVRYKGSGLRELMIETRADWIEALVSPFPFTGEGIALAVLRRRTAPLS